MGLPERLPEVSRIMPRVSNLVKNHLQGIVDNEKNYHLSKRPQDRDIIEGVAGGFYAAIEKRKKEGK